MQRNEMKERKGLKDIWQYIKINSMSYFILNKWAYNAYGVGIHKIMVTLKFKLLYTFSANTWEGNYL